MIVVSPTKLQTYEACPRRAKFAYLDKIAVPEDPSSPALRGTQIHEQIEAYIRGTSDLLPVHDKFKDYFGELRTAYEARPSIVQMEELWAFDAAWQPVPGDAWDQHAFRAKLDYYDQPDEHAALVYDWKTGQKDANVVKHIDQLLSYAISAMLRTPTLAQVHTACIYVDLGETLQKTFEYTPTMQRFEAYRERVAKMQHDTEFFPKPSKTHCTWCPYKTGLQGSARRRGLPGTGHCDLNPE